jgi:TIR domain
MLTLKRLGAYLITFFISVSLVIGLVNWKWMDNYLVNKANTIGSKDDIVNDEIVFVNLENTKHGNGGEDLKAFRQNVIKFLNAVADESKNKTAPKAVVLDIWFSNDTTELDNLEEVLLKFKQELKIPVYAAYNIADKKNGFETIEADHAVDLYNNYLAGSDDTLPGRARYHTFFYQDESLAGYYNDVYLQPETGGNVLIESLARRVALDLPGNKTMKHEPKREGSIVPYGSFGEMKKRTYTFIPDSVKSIGSFLPPEGVNKPVNIANNILVVGDVVNDIVHVGVKKIPGTYIVTWALSDILSGNSRLKLPVENLYVIIGQTLFFALFTVLIFALLFKYVKRLQTKPTVIAVLSFLTGLIFLFIYGILILNFNSVIPIGHTIVAMAVASLLCWRFAHKFLVTGVAEGSQKYDVFISYSHGQSDWVMKNVYEPLAAFRKPNGDKLNIFFDKKSIGIGEAFTAKYMWAIVDTKCFIPVISEDYYGKNHCRNELDLAVNRKVEKKLEIQMITFSFKAVPEPYRTYNFVDITVNPNFIESIKAQLSQQPAT